MRIGKILLGLVGVYGLIKVVEMLNLGYEEEVDEIRVKTHRGVLPEEDEYYDIEYTDDEDILDELEEMEPKEVKEVVEEMGEELREDEADEPMIAIAGLELSKRQNQILGLFDKQDKVETDQIAKRIKGANIRTLRRDLVKLEDLGLIKKIGKTKGSFYMKLSK